MERYRPSQYYMEVHADKAQRLNFQKKDKFTWYVFSSLKIKQQDLTI